MVFLIPILAPILFPIAFGTNLLDVLAEHVTLQGVTSWDKIIEFLGMVWHSMTVML